VRYGDVRALKSRVLRRAFVRFVADEIDRGSARAAAFQAYQTRESWWLDAYTVFRALHAAHEERAWWDWPSALAYGDPAAVRRRAALAEECRYRAWLQWIAETQAGGASGGRRARAGRSAVHDFRRQPDVWSRGAVRSTPRWGAAGRLQRDGQDQPPPWRWDVMQSTGFRRPALPHGGPRRRTDHLRAYRIYVRPFDDARQGACRPTSVKPARRKDPRHLSAERHRDRTRFGHVPPFGFSMARLGVPAR
jgi:hypothetical protein